MTIHEQVRKMKETAPVLAAADCSLRNNALLEMREALMAGAEAIFAENEKDLAAARQMQVPVQVQKRLLFDEKKLKSVCEGLTQLAALPDPLGRKLMARQMDEGLNLYRISVPIGVIGVIFEARPDALVQISSLCIKSGNCAVLKGGKETANTNRILCSVILGALVKAGLPKECLYQVEERSEIKELLSCDEDVDLLIPRGSNAFVRYIMENTKIPVMGHADGVCHIFVDKAADLRMALDVILDAKTQYPVACNAVETILVHAQIADEFLPMLRDMAEQNRIVLHGSKNVQKIIPCEEVEEFHHEYGDLALTVEIAEDVKAAAAHINRYGSHHTDCIITADDAAGEYFMQMVDSAGVYRNCSTRFADGFRYGFGAEVGISTGKLHARGPVGLEGLVTYKYRLYGAGQIVGDYVSGAKSFHFREL